MPNGKWIDNSRSGDGSNPKTKLDTYIEFFDNDLQNIPLNTQVNITLNFRLLIFVIIRDPWLARFFARLLLFFLRRP